MKLPFLLVVATTICLRSAMATEWSWDPMQRVRCVKFGKEAAGGPTITLDSAGCRFSGQHHWYLTPGPVELEATPNDGTSLYSYSSTTDSSGAFVMNWTLDTISFPSQLEWHAYWALDYPDFGGTTASWSLGPALYYNADQFGSITIGSGQVGNVGNAGRVTGEFVAKGIDPVTGYQRTWIVGVDCDRVNWGDAVPENPLYVNAPAWDVYQAYFAHMDGRVLGSGCWGAWQPVRNLNVTALFARAAKDLPGTFPVPAGGWSNATFWGYYVGVEASGRARVTMKTKNRSVRRGLGPGQRSQSDIGVFDPWSAVFMLRDSLAQYASPVVFQYGQPGDLPVVGDWDGDGIDTIGVFRHGEFHLRNSNSAGYADLVITLGQSGDTPVAGDWDGDGKTDVGVFRDGFWKLRDSQGYVNEFQYGAPGMTPFVGDWTGSGFDTVGVRAYDWMHLRTSNTSGFGEIVFLYGTPDMLPLAGDFDGNGSATIGLFRDGVFYLKYQNETGYADVTLPFGSAGDIPLAGDWDGLASPLVP